MAKKVAEVSLELTQNNRQYLAKMRENTAAYDRWLGGINRSAGLRGLAFGAGTALSSGLIAALAPMALFSRALEEINNASHLVDTADKIGITTTALQELSFGFSQAGVEQASFETGMTQFSKRIGEAATNGGQLADILKANGIAIRDANGQIRTSEELLPLYADLIKNARSEQEKMLLVTQAFGRGGGDMLNGLNQGAEGINNMKAAAKDAGGVIDEELLRRAEELGDRWDAAWRRFSLSSQSAILSAIDGMARLNSALLEHEKLKNAGDAGDLAGSLVGKPGDVLTPGTRARPTTDDVLANRMGGALTNALDVADQKLVEELQKRYGKAAEKATVIPSSGSGAGNKSVKAAVEEVDAVMKMIEQLRIERAEIGMTDVQREKSRALRQAGAGATKEERAEIELLIESIYRENDAREKAREVTARQAQAIDNLFQMGGDAIMDIVDKSATAEDAIKRLAVQLALAAAQAALLGTGPLAGIFGRIFGGGKLPLNYFPPAPGGGGAGLFKAPAATPAASPMGGITAPRVADIRGPSSTTSTMSFTYAPTINAPNADAAGLTKVQQQMAREEADLPTTIIATLKKAKQQRII